MSSKKFAEHCSLLGHGLAIACAVSGLALIVAAPLNAVVYGVALFCAAIAIDVIVAVHCPDLRSRERRVSRTRAANSHGRRRNRAWR